MGLAGRMASADSDDEDEDKLAGSGAAPTFYTADMAKMYAWTAMHASRTYFWANFTATLFTFHVSILIC